MSEHQQGRSAASGAGASVAVGFVLGALVGAGIALLLAPATGRETRRRLTDAGSRLGDTARGTLDHARDVATDLARDAQSAWEAGRETLAQASPTPEPRSTPPTGSKG